MIDGEKDLKAGNGTRIDGLKGKPAWNGQVPSIFAEQNAEGRWPVMLANVDDQGLVRSDNLSGPLLEESLDFLLAAKANPSVGNHNLGMDRTFLHTAAINGSISLLKRAVSAGCP